MDRAEVHHLHLHHGEKAASFRSNKHRGALHTEWEIMRTTCQPQFKPIVSIDSRRFVTEETHANKGILWSPNDTIAILFAILLQEEVDKLFQTFYLSVEAILVPYKWYAFPTTEPFETFNRK
jgi:hypothetical protein